jgi:L-rhamnose mutarotase
MKNFKIIFSLIVINLTLLLSGCHHKNGDNSESPSNRNIQRIGMVIRIDSSRVSEYMGLHADSNPGVRDLLIKYHLNNFSIFMTKLDDGNFYEFGYYEYTGSNFEADMAALDAEPRNIAWLKVCDPMQIPLKGETSWKKMKQVYFNR